MDTTPKLFAVGDAHGHFDELVSLYDTLLVVADLDPDRDTVVFLGDLVDGGPDTAQVLDWCMGAAEQFPHWVFLKGNHEDLMLDALVHHGATYGDFSLWWQQGGRETTESYQRRIDAASPLERALMTPQDIIPRDHLAWLYARPLHHETARHIFVHAGLRPGIPLAEQTREDQLWIRDEFIGSDFDFGKRVVYGHTPTVEPLVMPNKIGIDTMFRNKGKLTAVEVSGPEPVFYFQPALATADSAVGAC